MLASQGTYCSDVFLQLGEWQPEHQSYEDSYIQPATKARIICSSKLIWAVEKKSVALPKHVPKPVLISWREDNNHSNNPIGDNLINQPEEVVKPRILATTWANTNRPPPNLNLGASYRFCKRYK